MKRGSLPQESKSSLEKGKHKNKIAFGRVFSSHQQSVRRGLCQKQNFDPEKWQKWRFAPAHFGNLSLWKRPALHTNKGWLRCGPVCFLVNLFTFLWMSRSSRVCKRKRVPGEMGPAIASCHVPETSHQRWGFFWYSRPRWRTNPDVHVGRLQWLPLSTEWKRTEKSRHCVYAYR